MKKFTYVIFAGVGALTLLACQPGPIDPPFQRDHNRPTTSYSNKAVPGGQTYAGLGVSEMWKQTSGKDSLGNSVVVAVIGTGVDYTNPDIRDVLWTNAGELGEKIWANDYDDDDNGYNDDVFGYDFYSGDSLPYDWHGHDTYTAAIIAASGRKHPDMIGIAPNASLMVLRYIGSDGRAHSVDAYLAIQYAVQNKARIIYLNWPNQGFGPGGDEMVTRAIEMAGEANVLVVIPAGNDSNQDVSRFMRNDQLQRMEHVLIVAGHDENLRMSATTNYGRKMAGLAARSTGVRSFLPGQDLQVGALQTSSVAAAQVAGAAALIASLPGKGAATEIRRTILDATEIPDSGRLEVLSGGVLSLHKLVTP